MKYKPLILSLLIVSAIFAILPQILFLTSIKSDDLIYIDATLAQPVKCFDENGQVALCIIIVNETETVFLLNDWKITDIDLLASLQNGDIIKLGIKKDTQNLINQSPSLPLVTAETENVPIATIESYTQSLHITQNIISGIGFIGIAVSIILLFVFFCYKEKAKNQTSGI